MFTIIQSYYTYHKYVSIIAFTFVFLVNLILALSGDWHEAQADFPGLRVIWITPFSILFLLFHLVSNQERRNRMHRVLPISSLKLALSKLLAVLTFWIVTLFVLLIFHVIMNYNLPNSEWIFDNIAMTGIFFTINAYPLIYNDLLSVAHTQRNKIIISSIWAFFTILIVAFLVLSVPYLDAISPSYIDSLGNELSYMYLSSTGKILLIVMGICFSLISIYLFTKRKTYLV